jgi:Alpha/beta hydrolase domain
MPIRSLSKRRRGARPVRQRGRRPALAVRRRAHQHVVRQLDRRVVLLHAGHEVPFDQARLRQLYPTHGAYVLAVTRNVAGLVAGRYITAPDGTQLVEEAARADVP